MSIVSQPGFLVMEVPSFSEVRDAWQAYCSESLKSLAGDDVRHDLALEVSARLRQLDIALTYSKECQAMLASANYADLHLFDRLRLFAESFYFTAWRLRQVLNSRPPRDFPGLPKIKAVALVKIRNHLIEHPDQLGADALYKQHLMLTDCGLVLKTAGAIVRPDGSTRAFPEHIDQGLFANAATCRSGRRRQRRFTSP